MRAAIFNRMPLPSSPYPMRIGNSAKIPARSAYELRLLGLPSGVYWLDKGGGPYQAYCDLLTLGGGWEKADGFSSTTTLNTGGTLSKASYDVRDAASVMRYTGPINTSGGGVADNAPLPFAAEYLLKSSYMQAGGGGGPNLFWGQKPGSPIAHKLDFVGAWERLQPPQNNAVGDYQIAHIRRLAVSRGDRYKTQALWGLSPDPVVNLTWITGSQDDWSVPIAYDDLYLAVIGWGDTTTACIADFSLWIRES